MYQEGRRLIEAHRSLGHEVVIVTSATRYQAEPVARVLGVSELYCTSLEIEDGLITGNVTPCYGADKRTVAEAHLGRNGGSLADAYFYSDSSEDLPLLEAVGHPVAVNAKTSLSRTADERGWPQLDFQTLSGGDAIAA